MKIITVPHENLRKQSVRVEKLEQSVLDFIKELKKTLAEKRNPRGVGLSSPQVNESYSIFVTHLPVEGGSENEPVMRTFINPQIVKTSPSKTFGEDVEQPILEGCLSIPHLYGPVPRYNWVEVEFQTPEGDRLVSHQEKFSSFAARVMQHEYDHLQGKLFTDYLLEFELPLYDDSAGKLKEIDRQVAKKF